MQDYRINYTLLIGLIIGTFVCSGAIYGLHHYQNSRQAGWLINEAERSLADKNYRDATQYYGQYLTIHPEDQDTRIKYANTFLDLTEQDDAQPEEITLCVQVMETMLRNPAMADVKGMKEVRRRLVTLYGRDVVRNYGAALDHLNFLLEGDPTNAELQSLRATYLAKAGNLNESVTYSYKLIGYDPKKDAFDVKKASALHSTEVYSNLASILRSQRNKPELASKVVNQMVDVNRTSAEAYVTRGRLLAAWGNAEDSRKDAKEALKLKPDDVDVLLLAADIASQDKDFDKAREYLAKAKKLHPKEPRVYQRSAALEMQQNKIAPAMAEFDAGAKAVGGSAAINLLFYKTRLQIESNDIKGARNTIDDMQKIHKLPPEVIDYFDAIILVSEGKWFPASEALSKLRPRIGHFGREMSNEIDFDLALCYERLARYELAQQYYEQIVQQNPQNAPAIAGVARTRAARGIKAPKGGSDPLQTAMVEELKKDKSKRDWTKINAMIEELTKKPQFDKTNAFLIKAQVAMMREDYDAANQILVEANKQSPKNLQIYRFKVQLARLSPEIGPEKAMDLLQKVVALFGDQAVLRLDKADLLIDLNKNKQDKQKLKDDLANLFSGVESWPEAQKVELWRGMGGRYLNLGMLDEARQYLNLVAEKQPNELPLRLDLFSMALEAQDDEGMKAAEDKILEIVRDKNDSAWLYAEARRKLWQLRRGQLSRDSLADIRALVKRALDQRSENGELYALMAEIDLLSNSAAAALKNYDRAEELGRLSPPAVAQHIKLLGLNGRYADAAKLLDRIPEGARQTLLGPLYAEILFRTNQVDAAVEQARAATVADPTNAQSQYWYSQLLVRSAHGAGVAEARRNELMTQAIQAMQKATQLQPEFADAWFSLINFNLMQNNENEAQKVMRDAQLVLSGDNLTAFLAKAYESLRRWFDAETMYRELYEINPSDLQRAQQLASFYLGPLYPRTDKKVKATPLLNQLLKGGADGKLPPNDTNLLWARRMSAKLLADTGSYQDLLKAENLLASNSQDGSLLIEDKLGMAEILAPRFEPISKKKARGLLEEVSRVQPLSEAGEIMLAGLYLSAGDWSNFQSNIKKTIGKYPNSARARDAYARALLARGDQESLNEAGIQLNALQKIAPGSTSTFELTVRLFDKLGKQQEVRAGLLQRMPHIEDVKTLDEAQERNFLLFANLLTELKDYDSAEKIYTDLAARDPKMVYELAKFLGLYRSPELCFAKLNELYSPEKIPEILSVAMTVNRDRRDKVGTKFDTDVQRWLDAGLRENPDAVSLLLVQADLYDLQKKYKEAADIYRKLLDSKDLTGIRRAVVLNNLAYIIALSNNTVATDVDAMKLIVEATQILGPNSDILDTRAVVLMSRGDYKAAIDDLELSVLDGATASKYFHKAVAHLKAGENSNAVEAWKKAEGLGLSRDSINRMELDLYEKIKVEINKIRGPAVTKSESRRKAG